MANEKEVPVALEVDTVTGETTETFLSPAEILEIKALFAQMNLPESAE
jgi:hypothetical protein